MSDKKATHATTKSRNRVLIVLLVIAVGIIVIMALCNGQFAIPALFSGNGNSDPDLNEAKKLLTATEEQRDSDLATAAAESVQLTAEVQSTNDSIVSTALAATGTTVPMTVTQQPGAQPSATPGAVQPSFTPSGLYEDGCIIVAMDPCNPDLEDWAVDAKGDEVKVQHQYANTPLKATGMNDKTILSIHIACPKGDAACHDYWASYGAPDIPWWGINLTYDASVHGDIAPQYNYTIIYYLGNPTLGDTAARFADALLSRSYIQSEWVQWRIQYNP